MNKKVKLPKYPCFYMWEKPEADYSIYIWYPDGSSERLETNGEWVDAYSSFQNGPYEDDVKICEIKD